MAFWKRRRPPGSSALVLSGGGSRGAYQVGVWRSLHEAGYRPDVIVGTSVGAINGAFIASGTTPDEARDIWLGLNKNDITLSRFDVWRFWKWRSLLRHDPLRKLLEGLDYDALHTSDTRFLITAVDVCCGEVQVWENEEITVDHLLASSAIPGALPPVEIDGHVYLDGGIANSTPLRPAVREGVDEVVTVLTDPAEPHKEAMPRNVIDVIARIGDIQTHLALSRELVKGREINDLIAQGTKFADWKHIDFHVIAPDRPLGGKALDFDPAIAAERILLGEVDGEAQAPRINKG